LEPDYNQVMNDPTSRYLKGKLSINNGIWIELARLWTKPTIRHALASQAMRNLVVS